MRPTKHTPKNEALERAIERFKSLSDMAEKLGLSGYQVIQSWRKAGRVPPDHCTKLAQLTGVNRDELVGWEPLGGNEESIDDAQPTGGTPDRKRKKK